MDVIISSKVHQHAINAKFWCHKRSVIKYLPTYFIVHYINFKLWDQSNNIIIITSYSDTDLILLNKQELSAGTTLRENE